MQDFTIIYTSKDILQEKLETQEISFYFLDDELRTTVIFANNEEEVKKKFAEKFPWDFLYEIVTESNGNKYYNNLMGSYLSNRKKNDRV